MFDSQPVVPPSPPPASFNPQARLKSNRKRSLIIFLIVFDLLLAGLLAYGLWHVEIQSFASSILGKFGPGAAAITVPLASPTLATTAVPTVGKPSSTPTSAAPLASPTPTIPYMVWSKDAGEVVLFGEAAGKKTGSLANGSQVTPGEKKDDGWVFVQAASAGGWVQSKQVYQIQPGHELRLVNEPGAYLRDGEGAALGLLPTNSPVFLLSEKKERDGITWVRVVLLDGREGWVAQYLLHVR